MAASDDGDMDHTTADLPTCTQPPTAAQLRRALSLLAVTGPARTSAAVHLALPIDAPLGMAAWLENGIWHFRGHTVADGDPVEVAVALAGAGHTDADHYHDLDEIDPVTWCKLVRTGSRQVLFGADLLVPGPSVAATEDVPDAAVRQALRLWVTDPEFRPPVLVDLPGGSFLVDGGAGWMMLRRL